MVPGKKFVVIITTVTVIVIFSYLLRYILGKNQDSVNLRQLLIKLSLTLDCNLHAVTRYLKQRHPLRRLDAKK
jgi:hypothetical protein